MRKRNLTSIIVSVLIIGFAIATMIMKDRIAQKSDGQLLRDAQLQLQQEQQELQNKKLNAPDSCAGVPATVFEQICDNNMVYEDANETIHIPYYTNVERRQAQCVEDSYTATMSLFARQNGRVYKPDDDAGDSDAFISLHACEVSGDFALFISDFSLGDADVDAAKALNLWYQYDSDEYCHKSKEHSWCS